MDKQRSLRIFIGMIVLYAVLAGISVFLPQGAGAMPAAATPAQLPVPLPVLALISAGAVLMLYGTLGLVGFYLARSLGFVELWDSRVTNRQRLLIPALGGVAVGILIIIGDMVFSPINGIGRFPHPPFPTSIVAAITAGIGEETMFRLFFICFWTWLVSKVILRGRFQTVVYWVVSVFYAVAFCFGHLPSLMFMQGWTAVSQVPAMLLVEVLLLNGIISLAAAYFLKKVGFLGPVGVHLWGDVVWHVIWGML